MPIESKRVCGRRAKPTPRRDEVEEGAGWLDRVVVDRTGREVGVLAALYRGAPHDAEPRWLGIDVGGLEAMRIVIAPVHGAHLDGDDVIVVAHDYEDIVSTPRVVVALMAEAIDNRG